MRVNTFALIGILILACLMITPALAFAGSDLTPEPETLTGTLSGSSYEQEYFTFGSGGNTQGFISGIWFNQIQYSTGLKSVILFEQTANDIPGLDPGAPAGSSIPAQFKVGTQVVANGSLGFQRYFRASDGVEQPGYIYAVFDDWDQGALTGGMRVNISYQGFDSTYPAVGNHNATFNQTWIKASSAAGSGDRFIGFCLLDNGGVNNILASSSVTPGINNYLITRSFDFENTYTATKPSGLMITGQINKTIGGTTYPSRVFIVNALTDTPITNELTVNVNNFSFNTHLPTIKIAVLDSALGWHNSSILFNTSDPFNVTPTVTPIAGAVYSISTSTDYVNVSGTNIVTISSLTDPTLADLKYIHYGYSDSENADAPFYEIGSTVHATAYTLVGGTWYGYDSADVDYNNVQGAIPNPATLKWDTTSGDKSLTVTLQNSAGDYTYLYRTIHVGQGSQTLITTKAQAMDGTNGGELGMVSMQIYNHNTQTWTNLSPNNGLGSIITPPNTILSFYAQKAGFTNGSLLNQPARGDLTYQIPLYIGPTVGAGFVNYFVTVQDAQGYPLGAAQIVITPASGASKAATSSTNGGSQIFNLTASTVHTWTVTKSGYQTKSGSFTTGTVAGSLVVQLSPIVTPTKTVVMPTGSWTVNPSYTPSGNLTGFWSPWVNVFSQMGANTSELPLLIAAMLICFCMAAGFGMGGILGGEVAMGFGAIFCVALGLIPIWVVLAIIILGFLFYGLKIGR
jgi:hypothetical protein